MALLVSTRKGAVEIRLPAFLIDMFRDLSQPIQQIPRMITHIRKRSFPADYMYLVFIMPLDQELAISLTSSTPL